MTSAQSTLVNRHVDFTQCEILSPLRTEASDVSVRSVMSDIRPLVSKLVIYENIFSPVLSGELFLQDDINLTTLIPLLGVELLRVKFTALDSSGNLRTYGNASPIQFSVYNQTNRMPINQGTEQYRLGLVSPELMLMSEKRFSKAYKNVPVEDVVRDILMSPKYCGTSKAFTPERTNVPTNFVVPYLTPIEAIKLATMMAQSPNADTNYVFFETLTGFKFSSIRQLIVASNSTNSKIPVIRMALTGVTPQQQGSQTFNADEIDIVSGFDFLQQLTKGAFASTTIGIDILAGKYQHTITTLRDDKFASRMLLDGPSGVSMYPTQLGLGNPTGKMFLVPTTSISAANSAMTSLDSSIRNNFIETTLPGRNRELLALSGRCVRAKVSGAPELQAGTLVDIEIPSPLNNNKLVPNTSDIASGRYLIVAAKHELINIGDGNFLYDTVFEAYSDSYRR
jgi:hypothetical protein